MRHSTSHWGGQTRDEGGWFPGPGPPLCLGGPSGKKRHQLRVVSGFRHPDPPPALLELCFT